MAKNPTPAQTVAQILAAQLHPINAQNQAAQARLAATNAAVLRALQGGIPAAQATYDNAVQQTDTLAQNAARMLGAASPNAQTQSELRSIGAPVEQQQQLAQQAQNQFGRQGGVLYTQQGSIPGASLLAQRQGQISFLAGLPTIAALQGGESSRQLAAQASADRARVTGQAPALLQQLQQTAADNAYRQQQAAFQRQQAAADQQFRQTQFNAQQAAAKAAATGDAQDRADANYWKRVEARQNQERINQGTGGSAATPKIIGSGSSGYYTVSPDGKVKRIVPPAPGTGKSPSGLTLTQTRSARAKGNQLLAHVRAARVAYTQKTTNSKGELLADHMPTYDEAVQQAEQQGIPLDIVVPMLNKIYPVQYEVTDRGLKQIGIRGYPSTFASSGTQKKRKRR